VTLYEYLQEARMEDPVMVLAMSGWVDAASVGTEAAGHLAEGGEVIAKFDRDALFDYRSSRPVLHFEAGVLNRVVWPRLNVVHNSIEGRDFVVVTGNEPDFRWMELSADMLRLAGELGVERLITLGAVPAQVPHTRPVRVVCTTSGPDLLLEGDDLLPDDLVVPGAAVSILRDYLSHNGISSVGYWVQVPHYLNQPFPAGVVALLERVGQQLGVTVPIGNLPDEAEDQRRDIDAMLEDRSDAREYVERLEGMVEDKPPVPDFEALPSADEIGAEVERFLRSASDED
jgi:predicted ATP-grasp superfamily ATP-dependent carboligase